MLPTDNGCGKVVPFRLPLWHEQHPEFLYLDRRLAANHLARRVAAFVATLDLTALLGAYGGYGSLPYHPRYLLQVALYETHLGHRSPGLWHRHAHENEPVRWLARGLEPSRSAWYAFRDRLGLTLLELNRQLLHLAQALQITDATAAAQDGTTVAANSSRHRLHDEATLRLRLGLLQQACDRDDKGQPEQDRPAWMARRRGRRRQRDIYQRALARLQQQQQDNQQKRACDRKDPADFRLSLGDSEAPLGPDKLKVCRPLYNVQYLRDLHSQLILAYGVFAQVNDAGTFAPLMRRADFLLGHAVKVVLADSAYATGPHLAFAEENGILVYAPWQQQSPGAARHAQKPPAWLPKEEFRWRPGEGVYVCPRGARLELTTVRTQQRSQGERVQVEEYRADPGACQGCPLAAWCTPNPEAGRTVSRSEHEGLFERLRQRMETAEAQALYKLRSQTVERSFAESKQHRQLRQFSGRGLARAEVEVGLLVLVNNGLIVQQARQDRAAPGPGEPAAA